MTAAARIRQADIRRAIKALESVGKCVKGVKITSDGGYEVLTDEPANDALTPLERWRAEGAKRAAQRA